MTKEIVTTKISVFQRKEIRKIIHKNEWRFSVIDIIEVLTGTERPRKYWNDLKKKLIKEGYSEVSEKIGQLKLEANDGKKYTTHKLKDQQNLWKDQLQLYLCSLQLMVKSQQEVTIS